MKVRSSARLAFVALALLSGQALGAAPPLADTLKGRAKSAYEAAKLLYNDKDFAGASIKFREAYEESGDARLLWNVAASEKNLRHYERAVANIRRYLAEAAALITEEQKSSAEQAITTFEALIGEVTVTVEPADARVRVDGEERIEKGAKRVLRVDQGRRMFHAEREGFVALDQTLEVVGGKRFTLPLTLIPAAPPPRIEASASASGSSSAPALPLAPATEPAPNPAERALAAPPEAAGEREASTLGGVHWGWWAGGAAALATAVVVFAFVRSGEAGAPTYVEGTLGTQRLRLGAW